MEKDVSPSHKRYMQGVLLSKIAPGVHRVLTESDLYRSKSVSGLPLKSELTNLIEKTLQEVEAGNSEERTKSEVEDCQVELNKKGADDKEEDKNGDYGQEEYGTRVGTAEQLEAQTEDLKMEEVLLEVQASNSNATNCSSFIRKPGKCVGHCKM
ncbi:hypothetical protein G0U57_004561 [Chelydra serpentina]|uniref:Uncharacterized protein n=1 Tax=Chelydra serpentina TaxID=8475 RepID=A0A8T1TBQ9_CHESE|nr:hypothetical protein G0U57_004561 [Chelydra serpentina]